VYYKEWWLCVDKSKHKKSVKKQYCQTLMLLRNVHTWKQGRHKPMGQEMSEAGDDASSEKRTGDMKEMCCSQG
jgi:hypothetical protein